MSNKVTSISDLQLMFHRNERPIYFISATNFNLLGMDRWVNRFRYINYIDCFGRTPSECVRAAGIAACGIRIHRGHQQLPAAAQGRDRHDRASRRQAGGHVPDVRRRRPEALAKNWAWRVWFPPAALRTRCDNKMETVRIGNKAGVHSVPNALEKVDSYAH